MYRLITAVLCSLVLLGACSPENKSSTSDEKTEKTDSSKHTFPVISRGERVTLSEHVASGKYTVFKFTADW